MDETEARGRRGREVAKEKILGGAYEVLVLDELTTRAATAG